MTLSDLASIGSFASGLAVLISLIFLYFQLKQIGIQIKVAEKNQMASIRQGRTDRLVEMYMTRTDAAIAAVFSKVGSGDETITVVEYEQFRNFMVAYLNHAEDSFRQYEDGLLNDAAFDHFVHGLSMALARPGHRLVMQRMLKGRSDTFSEFIDRVIAKTPLVFDNNDLANWQTDIAAMRAKE